MAGQKVCQASSISSMSAAASAIDRGGVGTEYRWIAGSAHASSKKFASEFDQGLSMATPSDNVTTGGSVAGFSPMSTGTCFTSCASGPYNGWPLSCGRA
jgi:hypothetical protein